jgi:hypothetical protein
MHGIAGGILLPLSIMAFLPKAFSDNVIKRTKFAAFLAGLFTVFLIVLLQL